MKQFQVYELVNEHPVNIGESSDSNQACLAAWSRSKKSHSYAYVVDITTREQVDSYDHTYMKSLAEQYEDDL
jgi:hypothetical protein